MRSGKDRERSAEPEKDQKSIFKNIVAAEAVARGGGAYHNGPNNGHLHRLQRTKVGFLHRPEEGVFCAYFQTPAPEGESDEEEKSPTTRVFIYENAKKGFGDNVKMLNRLEKPLEKLIPLEVATLGLSVLSNFAPGADERLEHARTFMQSIEPETAEEQYSKARQILDDLDSESAYGLLNAEAALVGTVIDVLQIVGRAPALADRKQKTLQGSRKADPRIPRLRRLKYI